MTKSEIQQLIGSGRLKEAVEALTRLLPSHQQNTLILLQGRLNGLTSKEGMGIISSSDANIERNRITAAVLSLLSDLPDDDGDRSEVNAPPPPRRKPPPAPPAPAKTKSILFAAANPSDQARLQTDVELRTIKEEMQKGDKRDDFKFLPAQTAVRITELIRAFSDKPTIIHFAGHGEEEGIIISTNGNDGLTLNDGTMELLFKPLSGNTEMLLLNNCYSANQAKLISQYGILVVGYNIRIGDLAATSFSKGFYLGLSEGMTYEEAFRAGKIVLSAEHSSSLNALEAWKDGDKLDW